MDDINNKLDGIKDDLRDLKTATQLIASDTKRNTDSLTEHMRRTDLLEQKVEVLKNEVMPVMPQIQRVLKWWPVLSVVVIVLVSGKPEILGLLLKYLAVPIP